MFRGKRRFNKRECAARACDRSSLFGKRVNFSGIHHLRSIPNNNGPRGQRDGVNFSSRLGGRGDFGISSVLLIAPDSLEGPHFRELSACKVMHANLPIRYANLRPVHVSRSLSSGPIYLPKLFYAALGEVIRACAGYSIWYLISLSH